MFFVGSPLASSWFYHRVAPPHRSTPLFCDTRPPPYLRSTRWKLASSLGVSKICGVQHVMWWWMRSRGPAWFKWEPRVWPLRIGYFLKNLGLNNMESNERLLRIYVSCCVETHLPTIEKPWSIEFGTCTSQESIPIDQRGKNIGNTTGNTIY